MKMSVSPGFHTTINEPTHGAKFLSLLNLARNLSQTVNVNFSALSSVLYEEN